ncbi:MAG: metal ABC transporter substrate-binding protein [Tissierellaceae bacterium]|nr:metal ABC transporter substrate-binding protein [Tissierellaceae bacterium]
MKKFRTISVLLLLLFIIVGITGCGNTVEEDDDEKLKVYTSFYPMYDFTSKIAGDKISVYNMVPSGVEPHDWEPAASDIVNLEKADMFVYNGAGMEHWVEDVLKSLENKELVVVVASQGIDLLLSEDDDHDGHDHGDFDSHVWTNPLNVKIQMENIKDALVQLDPDNMDYYNENYDKYSKELDKLNEEFATKLSALSNKDIVVSHKAFSYLCNEYGLNQIAIDGLSPDTEPNPGRMAEIINFVNENNIKVIFFEELASPKVANTIADATGAVVDVLNPLEGLSDEELENGDDYFSVMRKNLEAILKALQ